MGLQDHILYMRVACFSRLSAAALSASLMCIYVALVAHDSTLGSIRERVARYRYGTVGHEWGLGMVGGGSLSRFRYVSA